MISDNQHAIWISFGLFVGQVFFPCDIIRWSTSHRPEERSSWFRVKFERSREWFQNQIRTRFPAWAGWRAALNYWYWTESGEEFLHSPFLTDCVVGQNKHTLIHWHLTRIRRNKGPNGNFGTKRVFIFAGFIILVCYFPLNALQQLLYFHCVIG